mmetsp:Transcript_268/g.399  ORF Transcript_268/g.399 Transcript_268/m.399 type:complete len:85 (-) Transcript_268:616-870(-)
MLPLSAENEDCKSQHRSVQLCEKIKKNSHSFLRRFSIFRETEQMRFSYYDYHRVLLLLGMWYGSILVFLYARSILFDKTVPLSR